MKTIINNLKKYMLISFLLISALTMADAGARYPSAPGLYNINLASVYVEVLSGNLNETALEIEEWMADASHWNYSWIAEASETEVVIENWMADASHWNYSWIAEASDTEVVIENWMADASHWNYPWIAEASEMEVEIENWMANPDIWKLSCNHDCAELNETDICENKMRLDQWMKDTERWTTGS